MRGQVFHSILLIIHQIACLGTLLMLPLKRSSVIQQILMNLKQRAHKEKKVVAEASKLAEALKQLEIKLTAKTAGGDKLFGSISNIDVAAAFEKAGQAIEKKFITVPGGTIKRTGAYTAEVRLHREVIVEIAFEVIAEA